MTQDKSDEKAFPQRIRKTACMSWIFCVSFERHNVDMNQIHVARTLIRLSVFVPFGSLARGV